MKNLFQAIMTAFKATPSPTLYTLLGGRLFYDHARQGTACPFGVMLAVSGTNFDTHTARITNVLVQFSFYSAAASPSECWDVCAAATDFLENTSFTVHGYDVRLVRVMEPLPFRGGENVWTAHGDYRALVQN